MPNTQRQEVTGETEGSGSSLVTWSCDATWDHALHMKSDLQFGRSQRPGRAFAVALSLMVAFAEPIGICGRPLWQTRGLVKAPGQPQRALRFAATWLRLTRVRANTRKTCAHSNFKNNQDVSSALQNASSPTMHTWLARRRHLQGPRFVRLGRLPLPASPTPSRTVACPQRLLVRVCFTVLVLLVHGREVTVTQTASLLQVL